MAVNKLPTANVAERLNQSDAVLLWVQSKLHGMKMRVDNSAEQVRRHVGRPLTLCALR